MCVISPDRQNSKRGAKMKLNGKNANRLSGLADLLKTSPGLTQEEAEDFGHDLEDVRAEMNRAGVCIGDSRKLDTIYGKEDAVVDPILGRMQSRSLQKDEW